MVLVPLAARQPALGQRDDPGAGGVRPGLVRADLHRGVPQQHGGAGGHVAQGEAGEELLGRAAHQLDDLAICADGQLQARAAAPSAAVCQCDQHWVELLLELFEQLLSGGLLGRIEREGEGGLEMVKTALLRLGWAGSGRVIDSRSFWFLIEVFFFFFGAFTPCHRAALLSIRIDLWASGRPRAKRPSPKRYVRLAPLADS